MYVCICNGITDKDIRQTVRNGGVSNAEEAYRAMGSEFCCGSCHDCAQDLVLSELPNAILVAAE